MPHHVTSVLCICEACDKQFSVYPSGLRKGRGRFCSLGCRFKHKAQKNPKVLARSKVSAEVKAGRITRPDNCSRCKSPCKPEAHHPDYSKPLDVVWLCDQCHDEESRPARLQAAQDRRKHLAPCSCGRKAITRGLCSGCYMREHYAASHVEPCLVPECGRKSHTRGLCNTCCRKPALVQQFGLPRRKRGPKAKSEAVTST